MLILHQNSNRSLLEYENIPRSKPDPELSEGKMTKGIIKF
jgi:hypothetical protein